MSASEPQRAPHRQVVDRPMKLFDRRKRTALASHFDSGPNLTPPRLARRCWGYLTAALLAASLACSISGSNTAATAEAMSRALAETATAAAANINLNAPAETAQAQATALGETAGATQTALAAESSAAQSATATAIAPMVNDLPTYGINSSQGQPGWVHPPVALDINGFRQYKYATEFASTVVRDFVVSADITWNTFTGLSGCGFALRADGKGNQYLAIATRGANGHVIFTVMAGNDVKGYKDFYAAPINPANDATNRFTVVGRGSEFTMYVNGVKSGFVDTNAKTGSFVGFKYERGFVALVGLSESGRTVCEFNNAWLWLLN